MEKPERNAPCWCGSGRKYKVCHAAFDDKLKKYEKEPYPIPTRDLIKNEAQIEGIRASSRINIAVLDYVAEHIRMGMSTAEIDDMVYQKTTELGGIPAPLGYEGFPKSCCVSINSVVCHGIPDEETFLEDGDIVNVDVSTIYNGYFSDSSRMFLIGNVSEEARRLVEVVEQSLQVGLAEVKPWKRLGDMGAAVHDFIRQNGYSVVREIGGHGIGLEFHEEPWVSYVSEKGTEMLLVPGMVFTIEPMVNMGKPDIYIDEEDDWTVRTDDGSLSAQWEITVLVTESGYEILTY